MKWTVLFTLFTASPIFANTSDIAIKKFFFGREAHRVLNEKSSRSPGTRELVAKIEEFGLSELNYGEHGYKKNELGHSRARSLIPVIYFDVKIHDPSYYSKEIWFDLSFTYGSDLMIDDIILAHDLKNCKAKRDENTGALKLLMNECIAKFFDGV